MLALVAAAAQDELLILPRGKVRLNGIDFDEDFLTELVAWHFRRQQWQAKPIFSDAYGIYMRDNPSAHPRKFKTVEKQPDRPQDQSQHPQCAAPGHPSGGDP